MKNKLKLILAGLAMISGMSLVAVPAYAADCDVSTDPLGCGAETPGQTKNGNLTEIIKKVTNVLLFLVGAISVIMMIVGGFKYTTSGGAPDKVGAAKNTILYAVVGVIVSMTAYAIINFVITTFQNS